VPTDSGFPLSPSVMFDSAPPLDILCVPGGIGTSDAIEDLATLEWVREAAAGANWITSVCTGSLILGAAGLLTGYRATTHWAAHHLLGLFGAIPVRERIVFDQNRVTGGGVTAGIDFALALAAAVRGEDHARFIQLSLEYDPAPPFDAGSPEAAGPAVCQRYARITQATAADRDHRMAAAAATLFAR
jgi:cyclohexyl-isocyanide hydratase